MLSYIRTADGFLTAMHDTAPERDDGHRIAIFNPGSNEPAESAAARQPGDADASVTIRGADDEGASPLSIEVDFYREGDLGTGACWSRAL